MAVTFSFEKTKTTDWIQAIGVVASLIIGLVLAIPQLFMAVEALERTADANTLAAEANRLAMVAEANGLLTQVNLVGLELERMDPTLIDHRTTAYSPRERLHLLRLQYVDRMHRLHEAGYLDAITWTAEQRYINWLVRQPSFQDMWERGDGLPGGSLREQYRATFRKAIDDALAQP